MNKTIAKVVFQPLSFSIIENCATQGTNKVSTTAATARLVPVRMSLMS